MWWVGPIEECQLNKNTTSSPTQKSSNNPHISFLFFSPNSPKQLKSHKRAPPPTTITTALTSSRQVPPWSGVNNPSIHVKREREMCRCRSRRSCPPRGLDPPQDFWSSHPITSVGPSLLEPTSMPSLSCSALMWYKWVLCLQRDLLFWFCSHPSHLLHLPHHLQIHSKVELKWVVGGLMWQWLDLTGVSGTVWPQEACKIHLVQRKL